MTHSPSFKHYTYSDTFYAKSAKISHCLSEPAGVKEYSNAIIEPLIMKKGFFGVRQGGVCTDDFTFIAGQKRAYEKEESIRSCVESYKVDPANIQNSDEEVIFGGILCEHFGHMLVDSLSRLWYFSQYPHDTRKVAFISLPQKSSIQEGDYHYKYLELAGVGPERVIIVDTPTRFAKVVVPDETIFPQGKSYFKRELRLTLSKIHEAVRPGPYKKIYFTRTGYKHKNPIVGERYFENLYRDMGFEIISPENYSLEEQLSFIVGAEEYACSEGTLSLFSMFSKNLKMTVFKRSHVKTYGMASLAEISQADINLIEIHKNFLPETQGHGVYLVGPNSCWKSYLRDNPDVAEYASRQEYNEEKYVWEYVNTWATFINKDSIVKATQKRQLKDIVATSNLYLFDKKINKRAFPSPDYIVRQRNECEAALQRVEKAEEDLLNNLIATNRSWVDAISFYDGKVVIRGTSTLLFANHADLDASLGTSYSCEAASLASFSVVKRQDDCIIWEMHIQQESLKDLCDMKPKDDSGIEMPPFYVLLQKGSSARIASPIFCPSHIAFLFDDRVDCKNRCMKIGFQHDRLFFDVRYVSYDEAFQNNVKLRLKSVRPQHEGFELLGLTNYYTPQPLDFNLVLAERELDAKKIFPVNITLKDNKVVWSAYFSWNEIYELSHDFPEKTFGLFLVLKKDNVEVARDFNQPVDYDLLGTFKALAHSDPYGNYIFPTQAPSKQYELRFKTMTMVLNQRPKVFISDFSCADNAIKMEGWCKSMLCVDTSFSLYVVFKSTDEESETLAFPVQFKPNFRRGFCVDWNIVIDENAPMRKLLKHSNYRCSLRIECKGEVKTCQFGASSIDESALDKMKYGFKYKGSSIFFHIENNKLYLRVNSLLKRVSKRLRNL